MKRSALLDPVDCISCLVSSRVGLEGLDANAAAAIVAARTRTEMFVESYRATAKASTRPVKRRLNAQAMQGLGSLGGGLRELLTASAAANDVDYSMPWLAARRGPRDLRVNDSVVEAVEKASSVTVLLDNAGEAVVDVALALRLGSMGKEVALVARGEEYEIDVTAEEAEELVREVSGVTGLPAGNVRVVSTGSSYPAPSPKASREAREAVMTADVVLSKGIGNLEAFRDYGLRVDGVVALYVAKCPPIARLSGVGLGGVVVEFLSSIIRR